MEMYLNNDGLYIHNIGWVEDDILYGVRTVAPTDSQIYMLNFNQLDTNKHKYIFPKVIGTLKRTGKSDMIVFHKRGSMLFYGDSNCLRVCDVSDLEKPVYIDSVICGGQLIENLTFRNDTIFVGEEVPIDKEPGIYVLTFKNNKFAVIDSFMIGGGGKDFYWSDKVLSFYGKTAYSWNFPLTSRIYDYKFTLPNSHFGDAMLVHKNCAFIATEIGIIIYNITNQMEFIPKDTLPAVGIRTMRIYRNLLLAGGVKMHLFDISNLDDLEYVAIYRLGGDSFFADSGTNYLYVMEDLNSPSIDRINIEKYVDETPVIENNKISNINQFKTSYSSLNNSLAIDNQFNNASISIIDPSGKLVQKFSNISLGRHVLQLNKKVKKGMYYAISDGERNANCKLLIIK
jgi:hypothetical protein